MEKINSVKELLTWATEVNQGVTLARKCDLQDIYAHTAQKDIDKFFIESEIDRKLVICSVNNCMAFDEVERLLKVLAKHKLDEMIQKESIIVQKEWDKINEGVCALHEEKRFIHRKLKEQKEGIAYFKERMVHFRELYQQEATKYQQAKEDAKKYRAIKKLLA